MPSVQQVPQLHKKRQGSRALNRSQGLQGKIQEDGQGRERNDTGKGEREYKMHKLEAGSICMSAEVDAMRKQPGPSMDLARRQHRDEQYLKKGPNEYSNIFEKLKPP